MGASNRKRWALGITLQRCCCLPSRCGSKWEERQKLATACMIKRLVGDLVILALLIAAHSVIVGLSYMPILLGGMGY